MYGPYSEPITIGPSDFTANETVDGGAYATPTDLAVIVPAFARGPGNAVNLPNSSGPIYSLADTRRDRDGHHRSAGPGVQRPAGADLRLDGCVRRLRRHLDDPQQYELRRLAARRPPSFQLRLHLHSPRGDPTLLNTSGGSFSVLTGIPISLSDTGGVTQATFTLSYNPALLNIASTTATTSVINSGLAGTCATFTVTANNTHGHGHDRLR